MQLGEGSWSCSPKELAHRYRLARFYLLGKDEDRASRRPKGVLRDAVKAVPDSVEAKVALVDLIAAHHKC